MEQRMHFGIGELTGLLDCFQAPVVLIDTDYRVIATNGAYRHHYGTVQHPGQRCYELSHRYSRPCHEMGEECPMLACLETGEAQRVLHLHHTPEGEEHVDVELCPIRDTTNKLSAFIEIMNPIESDELGTGRHQMAGRSPAFNRMLELVGRVAPSDATVLLLGESGTGKELLAHAVHRASPRAAAPFVPVDCSGLTESLFESELFGHEKGAFTGAERAKPGLVEAARGGTLFLDELGEIPLNLQVKLLRLLETGTYRRVGSVEPRQAEFRLIGATHRDLPRMVEAGEFRRDLYYRISAFPITLPPLRERREDLRELIASLLERIAPGRRITVDEDVFHFLLSYDFPGNIRELRNLLERALLLSNGHHISRHHFPGLCSDKKTEEETMPTPFKQLLPLHEIERQYLNWAVHHHRGDKSELAKRLGISRRTLYRKLDKATSGG